MSWSECRRPIVFFELICERIKRSGLERERYNLTSVKVTEPCESFCILGLDPEKWRNYDDYRSNRQDIITPKVLSVGLDNKSDEEHRREKDHG